MIKLIVGLGNPGRQYERTRHNVGFLFLDELVSKFDGVWTNEAKFHGLLAQCSIGTKKIILLKPNTFMNRSGLAVGKIARFYKLLPEEILVVHDELDFAVGTIKLKKEGGHAGHNGLRDIIEHLGSREFYRLRIGIGRPATGKVIADYVLSMPTKHEEELLHNIFHFGRGFIDQMITGDMAMVMNQLNSSNK